MKRLPKYIIDKCKRMEKLCLEAYALRIQVEKWCVDNGIDTNSEKWNDNVRDEIGGCDAILDFAEIEKILNERQS